MQLVVVGIFFSGVINRKVFGELLTNRPVDIRLIAHERAFAAGVGNDQWAHVFRCHVGDMEGASASVALNQSDNRLLWRWLAVSAVLRLAADIGFVNLD